MKIWVKMSADFRKSPLSARVKNRLLVHAGACSLKILGARKKKTLKKNQRRCFKQKTA